MNAERWEALLDEHAPHVGASGNGKWNAECLSVNCGWADHGSAGGMFAGAQAHRAHVAEVVARDVREVELQRDDNEAQIVILRGELREADEREAELEKRVEYVTQLNTEKAAALRQAQARIAEVADVAEERGYEVQRLREREARAVRGQDDSPEPSRRRTPRRARPGRGGHMSTFSLWLWFITSGVLLVAFSYRHEATATAVMVLCMIRLAENWGDR